MVLGGLGPNAALAAEYTFTSIADSTMPNFGQGFLATAYGRLGRGLAINNDGTVAFYANGAGIHKCGGATVNLVAGPENGFLEWVLAGFRTNLSLNNSGTVVFVSGGPPGELDYGVWVGDECETTLMVPGGTSQERLITGDVAINDPGSVTFKRSLFSGDPGIFVTDGVNETLIAGYYAPHEFQKVVPRALNNSGEVGFFGAPMDHGSGALEIYRGHGSPPTLMAELGPDFIQFAGGLWGEDATADALSINDAGTMAFWGLRADETEGIFLSDGGGDYDDRRRERRLRQLHRAGILAHRAAQRGG
jgi:hypothetical protein